MNALCIVLIPVQIITTAVGGCLLALTFGLLAVVLSIIWLPLFGLLVGTSWVWLKVPVSRPILLFIGPPIALVANIFVMLAPEPERDAKFAKLSIVGEWPLSYWLIRSPLDD